MNKELELMLPASDISPREQMLQLADISKKLMSARCKAMEGGLDAVLNELRKFSRVIESKQTELLAKHPELVLMAFE